MWNGEFFAAEVHFVHQDPVSKQRAVVGVFLALSPDDSDNPDLGTFFPQITKEYNSHSEVSCLDIMRACHYSSRFNFQSPFQCPLLCANLDNGHRSLFVFTSWLG
jgi:carbonic anhydrase